ncbi:molybdopterin-dependent oxidoreductase [Candidatus Fermentibacteria bacterium]|nr:molybdopterin-dependent oxidoreductase [Candidatus Fermentibacteria bacterium]
MSTPDLRWPWVDPYVADLAVPGMVYAALVRSSLPHAVIRAIDLAPALATPGVIAALDGEAFAVRGGVIHSSRDEPVLARGKVRYVGEPLAVVVGVSPEAAAAGANTVKIALDSLPPVLTMTSAEGATPLHENHPDNVLRDIVLEFGPVEESFSRAHTVFTGTYGYGASTHAALEPHGALAWWRPERRLWLWSSTQCPHLVHHELARLLALDPAAVRVMTPRVGGGFGGKSEVYAHEAVAAKLSMMLHRPVRIVLSREEVFYTHRGRHEALITLRMAVDSRHAILGLDADILLNGGAYAGMGLVTSYYAGQFMAVPYRVESLRFRSRRVFTNGPPAGPKRGHGSVQIRFAVERLMDHAALHLDLDPVAWRMALALEQGEATVNGLKIGSTGFVRCLQEVARHTEDIPCRAGEAVGFAGSAYICGAAFPIMPNRLPHSQALIRADRCGLFSLTVGVADIGQGALETLRVLAAETLGQPPSSVIVSAGDTDACPVDLGSYSSRVTLMAGNAVIAAAGSLRRTVLEAAARRLGTRAEDLDLLPGRVVVRDEPGRGMSLTRAIARAEERLGVVMAGGGYTPRVEAGSYPGGALGPSPAFSFSAAAARVSVDRELGTLVVHDIWLAHDCGRAVDLGRVRGQLHGCAIMALGEALTEKSGLTRGIMDPVGFTEYGIPTAADLPRIHAVIVEEPDPAGPHGAKEAGEGPLLPVVPAIANAVARAIGAHICRIPLTPDLLLGHGAAGYPTVEEAGG